MNRRRELKGIAAGLYGSFISRNNDVGGYWGIGKLCLHANESDVRIDLLNETIEPPSEEFTQCISKYRRFLFSHMGSRNIPAEWVSSADIELKFNVVPPGDKMPPITTWGSLFNMTVKIIDDGGKRHSISGYSYCAPHDPSKERKSAR